MSSREQEEVLGLISGKVSIHEYYVSKLQDTEASLLNQDLIPVIPAQFLGEVSILDYIFIFICLNFFIKLINYWYQFNPLKT